MKITEASQHPVGPLSAGLGVARATGRPDRGPNGSKEASLGSAGPAVRVEVSARGRELAAVLAAAAAAPDLRTERLEALRRQLAGGTYRVDPVVVARAMLEGGR